LLGQDVKNKNSSERSERKLVVVCRPTPITERCGSTAKVIPLPPLSSVILLTHLSCLTFSWQALACYMLGGFGA